MKKLICVVGMTAMLGMAALAAAPTTMSGYIMDSKCTNEGVQNGKYAGPDLGTMKGNVECVRKCLQQGSDAVLVADPSGEVFKIANMKKVVALSGEHVVLTGTLENGTLTVLTIKKSKTKLAAAGQ
ncbi:MAG TPA: hypothetical protein VN515_03070 [Terriglobales bacterium]|nr:hypothetical protein [Terriglobales bacterium]